MLRAVVRPENAAARPTPRPASCSGGDLAACSGGDLAAQLVLDVGADDLLEGAVGLEAHAAGPLRVDAGRPAADDALDRGVGLPADAPHGGLAADGPQRVDHLG